MTITHDDLTARYAYDPETGVFTNRKTGYSIPGVGGRYVKMTIGDESYTAHRLAWFYVHGQWPKLPLDHINADSKDNRISNLREAYLWQNGGNRRTNRNNKLGMKGVTKFRNKYKAQLNHQGQTRYLGLFATPELAQAAYAREAVEIYGEFARVE